MDLLLEARSLGFDDMSQWNAELWTPLRSTSRWADLELPADG